MFFIGKKDGKKQMVQSYRYLNEWTIRNNYPLPLISDIVENISTKKVFTKINLRWGYNNICIKERSEWKVTFTMPEGLFELTVMFFMLQTSFSLYLYNQWTDFYKLSCTGKPLIKAICTYVGCTKATTNN